MSISQSKDEDSRSKQVPHPLLTIFNHMLEVITCMHATTTLRLGGTTSYLPAPYQAIVPKLILRT